MTDPQHLGAVAAPSPAAQLDDLDREEWLAVVGALREAEIQQRIAQAVVQTAARRLAKKYTLAAEGDYLTETGAIVRAPAPAAPPEPNAAPAVDSASDAHEE